ncbi:MAG: hypothetical protein WC472_01175 [Candidatus Paceibacterota bacterium]
MANFESSNEKTPLTGKRIDLDWEEIRKGVLASNKQDKNGRPIIDTPVSSIDEQEEIKKITEQKIGLLEETEKDTLEGESMERPSLSEMTDSQRANEAKKELEEMFSTFSGPTEIPKEFLQKKQEEGKEESWNRPSGTEIGFKKEEGIEETFMNPPAFFEISKKSNSLEDQEELINRPININVGIPEEEKSQEDLEESVSFGINTPEIEIIEEDTEEKKENKTNEEQKNKTPSEINTEVPPMPIPIPPKAEKTEPIENKQPEEEPPSEKTPEDLAKEKAEKQLRERLEEVKTEIEKKKLEISKIVPSLLGKFGLPEKSRTKEILSKELEELEKEKIEIEKKLGITTDVEPNPEEIESSNEKLIKKIYDFIKREEKETENDVENLPAEKKTLFKKIKDLSKDRKVQAAVIGSILLGVSIAVPPVGGAAWLTGGLVSGFLPVSLGIPVKVLGGATAGMILRGSGGGISALRKIIENKKRTNVESDKDALTEEEEEEIKNTTETEIKGSSRFENISNKIKGTAFSTKEVIDNITSNVVLKIKKPLPSETSETVTGKETVEKNLTVEERWDMIKSVHTFEDLYNCLRLPEMKIDEINSESIIADVERIRYIIKNFEGDETIKMHIADTFTGEDSKQYNKDKKFKATIDIPEEYGINDKINALLKEEIREDAERNPLKETVVSEKKPDILVEKVKPETNINTFEDLYREIQTNMGIKAEAVKKDIEELRLRRKIGKNILDVLTKIPDQYKSKITELIQTEKNIRDFSQVNNFDALYKSGITEEEKANIKKIRLGQEDINVLKNYDLREKVLFLIDRDTKIISETKDLQSLYDALDIICTSNDAQNSFSSRGIKETIQNYIYPTPQYSKPEETLEGIPEIYGIRKKVLELTKKEENEKPLQKSEIERNPKILLDETNEKKSVSERIAEVASEKELTYAFESATTMEEFLDAASQVTDIELPTDGELQRIILNGASNVDISQDLETIPEDYGMRESIQRVIENEKNSK